MLLLALTALALADCPDGQAPAPNAPDQCCWPEQVWYPQEEVCLGTPTCPEGWTRAGHTCAASGEPPRGEALGDGPVAAGLAPNDGGGAGGLEAGKGVPIGGGLPGPADAAPGQAWSVSKRKGAQIGGDPIILGALDRAPIHAVVQENLGELDACYFGALTDSPELRGKVVVKFVIAKDGSVSSASTKSSTLQRPATEACLNAAFMKMVFPEPMGGGIVIVSYPLLFQPE